MDCTGISKDYLDMQCKLKRYFPNLDISSCQNAVVKGNNRQKEVKQVKYAVCYSSVLGLHGKVLVAVGLQW